MKNLFRILLVCSLLACGCNSAFAQKFGIINSQELLMLMPELDSVQIKLQAFNKEVQEQLETITVEFNNKYEDFQTKSATLTESTRQLKEKELQDIQSRYENYRVVSQQDGQKLQQQLMTPIIEKEEAAINKVAKAGGFLVVFNDAVGSTVYVDKAQVTDILPLVKKELGIPENAKPRGQQSAQ